MTKAENFSLEEIIKESTKSFSRRGTHYRIEWKNNEIKDELNANDNRDLSMSENERMVNRENVEMKDEG